MVKKSKKQTKTGKSENIEKNPWIIALISTDYDLEAERKEIISVLVSYGIRVSAFENPEFPHKDNKHSHENCIEALKRVDMAILIVNKRYGGEYYLNKDISITEEEYNSLEVPVVVLINKKTWDEREVYRKQLKNYKGDNKNLFKYSPTYVEKEQVFRFVDNIQNAYKEKGRSNWMNFWSDLKDLREMVPKVLEAFSVQLVGNICNEQIKEVKNKRTSTALSLALGDIFNRNFYMEPEYEVFSGDFVPQGTVSEEINNRLMSKDSCMIMADAGAGKTTLLAKCFLENAENNDNPFLLPVYIWLKGKGENYTFSVKTFFEDSFFQYFHKEMFPFLSFVDFRFIFYLDGFDEMTEKPTKDYLEKIHTSEMFQWPVLLTSRIQYAERYMLSNEFTSRFACQIKIQEWSEDTARKYISQFCMIQKKDEKYLSKINVLLMDNRDLKDVLKSPLLVTILLYVIERNRMEIPETVTSRATLFHKCLELLASREIETKYPSGRTWPESEDLVLHWAYFAWCIYYAKLRGRKGVYVDEAERTIRKIFKSGKNQWPQNIYDVLFEMIDNLAVGAFHEQFLEFLVAYCLAFACHARKTPYPDFLKYVMRPEINRYFRGIVEQKPESERNKIINNIQRLYWNCIRMNENDSLAKRVHAVYHLSRFDGDTNEKNIELIFEKERDIPVLQSLYFGVIKKGNMEKEQELYDFLNERDDYSDANRGYHLAYYDSLIGQKQLPYSDDITCSWKGTLNAFIRHFESKDCDHYYLRRIDLITMRQFMEYRKDAAPLTKDQLSEIERQIYHPAVVFDGAFQKKVEEEFQKVKEVFENYENTDYD